MAERISKIVGPYRKPKAAFHPYDPRAPIVAARIKKHIEAYAPEVAIEHIGSTAVPGCPGKGVVDLMALYPDQQLGKVKALLSAAGFQRQGKEFKNRFPDDRPVYMGTLDYDGTSFLVYVHVLKEDVYEAVRFRIFRDRLRDNKDLFDAYVSVKKRIVADGVVDTDDYAVRKKAVIEKILGDAYGTPEQEHCIAQRSNMKNRQTDARGPRVQSKDEVVAIMEKVADWQLAHPRHRDTDWRNGPLYAGIFELYTITRKQVYLNVLLRMGENNQWQPGKRWRLADEHCIGQTYLQLYLIKKDPRMLAPIRDTFDRMIAEPKKGREDWYWCDALFMAPPTLARLAAATGQRAYLDFMNTLWWDATDHLYDPKANLYFRDRRFFTLREKNAQKVFWGRGNGWVLAGLCRVLQYMPGDYRHRKRYVALFRAMSRKVASLQAADGFWRTSLLDPESYPDKESSCTGLFTYAFGWGINHGLLCRKTFLPVVLKAWRALTAAVDVSGKLGWVQPPGDRAAQVKIEDSETYGSGAFLLAGCEIAAIAAAGSNGCPS